MLGLETANWISLCRLAGEPMIDPLVLRTTTPLVLPRLSLTRTAYCCRAIEARRFRLQLPAAVVASERQVTSNTLGVECAWIFPCIRFMPWCCGGAGKSFWLRVLSSSLIPTCGDSPRYSHFPWSGQFVEFDQNQIQLYYYSDTLDWFLTVLQ